MFVYTVHLEVKAENKNDFISYLKNEHLPDVLSTGCFLNSSLETDTSTNEVIARYECKSEAQYDEYIKKYAETMRNAVLNKFPDTIINAKRNFCRKVM